MKDKYVQEMHLEYRCKPKNLRKKGGVEMCITKANVDILSIRFGERAA